MKLTFLATLSVMFIVLSTKFVQADLNVDRNGIVWPTTFEGNFLPEDTNSNPAWTLFDDNGFAARFSDGDIYSIVSGSTGVAASYEIKDTSWNTGAGTGSAARTVEFRARVPDDVFEAVDGSANIILGLNGTAYDLRLYADKVAYNGANINGGVLDPVNIINLDMTQFHTFRMTVDQNAATVFHLYIDNNPVPALATSDFWFNSPGFDTLVFGDTSTGGISGKSDWDFISWEPNAALDFPPTSDFDGDNDIDGADFLIWQRGFGLTGQTDNSNGDADGNGTVGSEDLAAWESEFGAVVPSLSAVVAAVPEPNSLLLVVVSLCALSCSRQLRCEACFF